MTSADEGLGKVTARHPGLIRDHHGEAVPRIHRADRVHREREGLEAGHVIDVADLVGERSVAIEEDGGTAHERTSRSRTSTTDCGATEVIQR